jgi:aspartate aminotransferase-like enzyme
MKKELIMMIGPTAVPERVLQAMNKPSISHRSPKYCEMHKRVEEGLQKVFGTKNRVIILTSSGTGAMEAVLQNCFSFGDEVVVPVLGTFSGQFAKMAEAFNLNVKKVMFEPGEAADVKKVMEHVTPSTKGVFVIHNESATGVFNDLKSFGEALKGSNALLVCDSVSGASGIEMKMDEWNIDILLSSSQKALMVPAGLAFVSLNEKAWERTKSSDMPKYYFNLSMYREFNEVNQTPNTPSVYLMFAIDEALKMIFEEGLDSVYKRHEENTKRFISGIRELGYDILSKDDDRASRTVSAVYAPGRAKEIVSYLQNNGIIVNGGLPPLAEDVFRVGIMGYVYSKDIETILGALRKMG